MTLAPHQLSEAVVVWIGWGTSSWPVRDDARVLDTFGHDTALDLLPTLRRIEAEFYESDAKYTVRDLTEMGEVAAERFRIAHPEISDDALRALSWAYTYDFK